MEQAAVGAFLEMMRGRDEVSFALVAVLLAAGAHRRAAAMAALAGQRVAALTTQTARFGRSASDQGDDCHRGDVGRGSQALRGRRWAVGPAGAAGQDSARAPRPARPPGGLGQRGTPGLLVHLLEPDLAQGLDGGGGQHRGLLGHVTGA